MTVHSNQSGDKVTDWSVFNGDHGLERPDTSEGFVWSDKDEPHCLRRREIMKKYGKQLQPLYGHEPLTKYIVIGVVVFQLALAYLLRDMAFTWQFFVVAYVFGATLTQNLFLAIHELSHNLGFQSPKANKLFSMFANLPIGIPYSAKFKGYHLEHHKHQGVDGIDTDIPTKLETVLFDNVFGKVFFATCQILFYALRPVFVRHQVIDRWFVLNFGIQASFDAAVVYNFGMGPIWYLLVSDFLAGSLHPCASHFIAEHYVFLGEHETYSYYGPLNVLCYNVGYHNEHHDFPNIPWTRLPKLREIASEFYDNMPQHESWPMVIWKFITDPQVSSKNRVKRKDLKNLTARPCGAPRPRPKRA